MKRQNISIYISILALFVSSISLWLSYQNREHDRLVAYEQRKQEVRQLMLEGALLLEKLDKAILEHVRTDGTPELREKAARLWSEVKDAHRLMESTVADFETLPATSGTEARLRLERVFSNQQQINKKSRELLEEWHKSHGVNNKEIRSPGDRTD